MKISDIFDLRYGHSLELNRLVLCTDPEAVNFVSRTARNNGVSGRVMPVVDLEPEPAGLITVALNGQGGAGTAFLQPYPFYTGYHVMVLQPKLPMGDLEKLWWVACITANRFRFGFGRQANKTLANLELPNRNSIPSWVSTTNLDPFKGVRSPSIAGPGPTLSPEAWRSFEYQELFELKKGQRLTKSDMSVGNTPFIGAIDSNNGYRQHVDAPPNHAAGTITVNYNGSVAEAFYQPKAYWASDDVNVLYPKFEMSPYVAMFICTIIKKEQYRFNYGRKWHLDRMKESIIRLPVDDTGCLDLELMEDFIRRLDYSSIL